MDTSGIVSPRDSRVLGHFLSSVCSLDGAEPSCCSARSSGGAAVTEPLSPCCWYPGWAAPGMAARFSSLTAPSSLSFQAPTPQRPPG